MKKINENVKRVKVSKWELLDREQREAGEELKELLQEKYNRVEMSYININQQTFDRGIIVDVYFNDYNYKQISLKYPIKDITIRDYFNTILHCFKSNDCKIHLATAEEIYLHNLIKENELEDFYISDGILMAGCEEIADLREVVSISKDIKRIVIIDNNSKCVIDLESETYYCEDIEDDEERLSEQQLFDSFKTYGMCPEQVNTIISTLWDNLLLIKSDADSFDDYVNSIPKPKEELDCWDKDVMQFKTVAEKKIYEKNLKEYRAKFDKLMICLEHLNSKSKFHKWSIENGFVTETDIRFPAIGECKWAKVEDIKEFYFDEDDCNVLIIEVKDIDDSIILCPVQGGYM